MIPKARASKASQAGVVPEHVRDLAGAIREQILKLAGVTEGARSFRIDKKIFVRFSLQADRVFLEFRLPPDEAKRATQLPFVSPMQFGDMGKHGWVEVTFTRKSELPVVLRFVRASHGLYRQF